MDNDLNRLPLARTLSALPGDEQGKVPRLVSTPAQHAFSLMTLAHSSDQLAWLMARLSEVWDSPDPRFGAAWLFEKTVEQTTSAFVASFVMEHRVPLAAADAIWVTFDQDAACSAPDFTQGSFACLKEDPQADHEHARILDSLEALRDCLLQQLHDIHLPLSSALAPPARRGLRTQLRVIADVAIGDGWWFAREYRGESEGTRYAELLGHGGPPLWGRTGLRLFNHRGKTFQHRVRNTCCLFYTRTENRYCFTCPMRSEKDRQQRWAAHFDALIDGENG